MGDRGGKEGGGDRHREEGGPERQAAPRDTREGRTTPAGQGPDRYDRQPHKATTYNAVTSK